MDMNDMDMNDMDMNDMDMNGMDIVIEYIPIGCDEGNHLYYHASETMISCKIHFADNKMRVTIESAQDGELVCIHLIALKQI